MGDTWTMDPGQEANFLALIGQPNQTVLNARSKMADNLASDPIDWDAVTKMFGPDVGARLQHLITSGQLGLNGRLILSEVARAAGAPPVYAENDIRNAGLSQKALLGSQWRGVAQGLQAQAGQQGLLDSGGYYDQFNRQKGAADANAAAAASGVMGQMYQTNQQAQFNRMNTALNALNQWGAIKKNNRLSSMALNAQLAYNNAAQSSSAGSWGALGAVAGIAGGIMGGMAGH